MFLILFGLRRRAPSCVPSRVTCISAFNLAIIKRSLKKTIADDQALRRHTPTTPSSNSLLKILLYISRVTVYDSKVPPAAMAIHAVAIVRRFNDC